MQKVEDPRQKHSGMTIYFMGFTLIELLVVVLIIGILAAVALPQYKVAVLKSRYAAIMPLTRAIKEAEERYYLANGKYTTLFEDLDLDYANVSGNYWYLKNGYCSLTYSTGAIMCGITNINPEVYYQLFFTHSNVNAGKAFCYVSTSTNSTDNIASQVCRSVSGKSSPDTQYAGVYNAWEIN